MISACPNKPPGWKLTTELKAAADAIRDAKIEQQRATRKVHASMASAARGGDASADTAFTSLATARNTSSEPSEGAAGATAAPGRTL